MNLPNYITLTRIFSIPIFMWLLTTKRIVGVHGEQELLACAVFIAASITDGIDGYIARRHGQITTMGILLDPLADKLMIAAAYITLVQINPHIVPAWMAVHDYRPRIPGERSAIDCRSQGFTIEASDLGKVEDGGADRLGRGRDSESCVGMSGCSSGRSCVFREDDCAHGHLVHGGTVAGVGD